MNYDALLESSIGTSATCPSKIVAEKRDRLMVDRRLRVRLVIDQGSLRQWHLVLLARLKSTPGLSCEVVLVEAGTAAPSSAELLFRLESVIHGLAPGADGRSLSADELRPYLAPLDGIDLVLDISGSCEAGVGSTPTWRLTYDGMSGESALLASLVARHAPVACLMDGVRHVASARLGTEHQGILRLSFEDCLHRSATFILSAIDAFVSGRKLDAPPIQAERPPPTAIAGPAIAKHAMSALAGSIAKRLYRLCFDSPHWRVGWRIVDGPDLFDLHRHPACGWRDLPDDGKRFYADPFPIVVQGRTFLFVEEFIHRLGRGIISAVEFGPEGPIKRPEPVLDLHYHLSYPFVFEREGEIWMVPESCAAGTIDLFRATAFPGGWVKEATLVGDIVASDATLVQQGGRWWMFATVRDGGGAFSDALHLWSAPDFRGPWTPHAHNPVMIDIASARPAGHMVERNGQLWRPVQDCRAGYGVALGLARIDRLDDGGFRQNVETILRAGPQWPGRRIHTVNRAGGFEFVDGSASAPLGFPRLRRAVAPGALHAPAVVR